jgi:hypothetical protein
MYNTSFSWQTFIKLEFSTNNFEKRVPDSSVTIETVYELDGPEIESRWG